jgi:hypothetical protein
MGYILIVVFGFILYGVLRTANLNNQIKQRGDYIDGFVFPETLKRRLLEKYPHLNVAQVELVLDGLRDYFHICNSAGKKMVAMPSQSVDVVWHEFILFTLQYQNFCKKACGRFLHHVPAEAMKKPTAAQQGIKLAWKIACKREGIEPKAPNKLPRIFALDALLAIPDGFKYALNCRSRTGADSSSTGATFCAGDIGCSSSCGSSGCSSTGGDGGSSCGGGCGGGGD